MAQLDVLYFTCVPLGTTMNGGALACREHAVQIASVPGVTLIVCTTGPAAQEADDAEFAASIGAQAVFLPWQTFSSPSTGRWPFLFEAFAEAQPQVANAFTELLATNRPDLLVVDYLPSALFIRQAYRTRIRRLTITHNRESRFFGDLRKHRLMPAEASSTKIAQLRCRIFEQSIYLRSHCLIAFTANDLPCWRPGLLRAVVPPVIPPRRRRWIPSNKGRLLFVGNIAHYPNRLAIEWLATRLAPALKHFGSSARLRILGASAEAVPDSWRMPNLDYLGTGEAGTAEQELCSADLFLAPIANESGSKMKLMECLAYGTPFAASRGAVSGIPFIHNSLQINLDRPAEAALMISSAIADLDRLRRLSERSLAVLSSQVEEQHHVWQRILAQVII